VNDTTIDKRRLCAWKQCGAVMPPSPTAPAPGWTWVLTLAGGRVRTGLLCANHADLLGRLIITGRPGWPQWRPYAWRPPGWAPKSTPDTEGDAP
jgi:hypothetical protein